MNQTVSPAEAAQRFAHSGLAALCEIAAFYRIAADPAYLAKELALQGERGRRPISSARRESIGLKARIIENPSAARLAGAPTPAILRRKDGGYLVLGGETAGGDWRIVDPVNPHRAAKSRSTNCSRKSGRTDPGRAAIFTARGSIRALSASCGSRLRSGATASRSPTCWSPRSSCRFSRSSRRCSSRSSSTRC